MTTSYLNAIQLSFMAHQGQQRRDLPIPYWTHVSLVSSTVAEWGGDEVQILAALCHDLIEDTDVQRTVIDSLLMSEVGSIVSCMSASKDKTRGWTTRKLEYVGPFALGTVDPRTYLVKCADSHANMTSFSNTAIRTGEPSAKPNTINTYVALTNICLYQLSRLGLNDQYRVASYNINRMLNRVVETGVCPDAVMLKHIGEEHTAIEWFNMLQTLWEEK